MKDYADLIKSLRVCGDMSTDQCDGCFKCDTEDEIRLECEPNLKREAVDAIEALQKELRNCRDELCLKCGNYRDAHKGACNGCRYKD